jgi:hypothetical protein
MTGARTAAVVSAGLPLLGIGLGALIGGRAGELPVVDTGPRLVTCNRRQNRLRRPAVVGSHHRAPVAQCVVADLDVIVTVDAPFAVRRPARRVRA